MRIILTKVNDYLKSEGKELSAELPHYWSPAEFDGAWIVTIKDPTTGGKIVRGSFLKPDIKKLQREFPGSEIGEPIERGQRASFDMEQFEYVLRSLSEEQRNPASAALAEGWRRRGIRRHGMKREGAAGSMGTEGGRRGLDAYEEVSEKHIRKIHTYLSNRALDKVYTELYNFEPAKKKPFAHGYTLEAIDQARGGMNDTMQKISEGIGEITRDTIASFTLDKVVMPSSALRGGLRNLNEAKSALLLGFANLPYMGLNGIQSTYVLPKLLGMGPEYSKMGILDLGKAVPSAMYKAAQTLMNPEHPDIVALNRLGTFDAILKQEWSTYATDIHTLIATTKDHFTGMSANMAVERHAVRKPSALMFLNMLREMGYEKIAKTPDEIYQLTKNMTDDYMALQARHKKPHIFGRTGLFGTATGPLQSFTTTWLAQLREYSLQALKTHQNPANVLPLASFLYLSYVTAGLIGMIGGKEWEVISQWYNETFNANLPGWTEIVMTMSKDDDVRFGMLSNTIGVNIGASAAAPTITGSFAPGVSLGIDLGKIMWTNLKELGALGEMNKPIAAEKRDALKGITPRTVWGWIEEAYTSKGMPVQTAKGTAGSYTRTEKDWQARKFGTYTLDEVKGKVTQYPVERAAANRSNRLKKASSLIVDQILSGENPEPRIKALVEDLQKDKYSAADIHQSIRDQFKAKVTEKDIRMMGKGSTTRQKLIIQMYNELR